MHQTRLALDTLTVACSVKKFWLGVCWLLFIVYYRGFLNVNHYYYNMFFMGCIACLVSGLSLPFGGLCIQLSD